MTPEEVSVLVRKLDAILEIRLVSTVGTITFELINNLRIPEDALVVYTDNITQILPVVNNLDGSFSITIETMVQSKIILELY